MKHVMLAKPSAAAPVTQFKTGSSSLRVNRPGDRFEQEAEHAADEVVFGKTRNAAGLLSRLSVPAALQRECTCGGQCEECKKKQEMLQREATSASAPAYAPGTVNDVLLGPGSRLEESTRNHMESRFGYDFSRVRIYHDATAAQSARAVSANAYTVGEKVVFNQGRYAPDTPGGQRLLAHELAHVVQQDRGAQPMVQRDAQEEPETDEENKSNSVLSQAFRAADARRWQEAARLANGLRKFDLDIFLSQYKESRWIVQLHLGALSAPGVGPQSAVALATEKTYKEFKKQEDLKYRRELAKQNGTEPPNADGSSGESTLPKHPLSVEEKKRNCDSGKPDDPRVFPLRMPKGLWRISVAPIHAYREGKDIVVQQPLNSVYADPMFHNEVKTLPLSTFTGGVRMAADDVVRVKVYDDNLRLACVSGEEMLRISDATDTAVVFSILRTVLDAATIIVPGAGAGLSKAGSLALAGTVGGGMAAFSSVAEQAPLVQAGLQKEMDWGEVGFQTFFGALTGVLLGAFGERLSAKLSANPTIGKVIQKVPGFVRDFVLDRALTAVQVAAHSLFNQMRGAGKKLTFNQFMDQLVEQLTDPQSIFMGIVTSAAARAAHEPAGPHGEPSPSGNSAPKHSEPASRNIHHETAPAPSHSPETHPSAHETPAAEKGSSPAEHEPGAGTPQSKPAALPSPEPPAKAPGQTEANTHASELPVPAPKSPVELPKVAGEMVVEPTAHAPVGAVNPRRPRGFEPTSQRTGKRMKAGTLEGLEPTAHPSARAPRKTSVTREQQLAGIEMGVKSNSQAAREQFNSLRDGYATKLGVGKNGQVHHAIELQVLDRYPGVFSEKELNELSNMRGIPPENHALSQLHGSKIREVWDRHYKSIDLEIQRQGLQPETPAYNKFVRDYVRSGVAEIDHVLGQFFSEQRREVFK